MRSILLTLCTLFLVATACAQAPTADPWPAQLVGRWEGPMGMGTYVEEWRKVDDGTYEGTATMYKNGKPVSIERTRLTWFAGSWLYIAATGGGITSFVRRSAENDTWIFENHEHDFPKRIGYGIKGDALSAWIDDGKEGGKSMAFHLNRVE